MDTFWFLTSNRLRPERTDMPDWKARVEGVDRILDTDPAQAERRYVELAKTYELPLDLQLYCLRMAATTAFTFRPAHPVLAQEYLEQAMQLAIRMESWGELTKPAFWAQKSELLAELALTHAAVGDHQRAWAMLKRSRVFAAQVTAAAVEAAT
jgi:hypothetical protein